MTKKLLEKSRNIFLSLTPPENLIVRKGVKSSKKKLHERNRINNSRTRSFLPKNLSRFFYESSHINNIHTTNTPSLDHLSLENRSIIAPRDHSAIERLHFATGGNIICFLNARESLIKVALQKKEFLDKNHSHGVDESEIHTRYIGKADVTLASSAALELMHPLDSRLKKVTKERERAPLEKNTSVSPFLLRWRGGNLSLAQFVKGQLYRNTWNSLFSSYDLNHVYNTGGKNYRASIKIKDQHKNQLMELRKIAILYGNLSKNYLTCLMQRSGASQFLSTLERRLDVVLIRALFFPTIGGARQWIHQGKVLVNNEICIHNSYLLQPGDLISIKEGYQNVWKREYFKSFKEFHPPRDTEIHMDFTHKTLQHPTTPFLERGGRFFFPPHIMRKWDRWCQLWGNSISRKKDVFPWSKWAYTWNLSLHPTFNNSVSADNFYLRSFMQLKNHPHKLRYTLRQSTPLLFWLKKLYRNFFAGRKQKHYMYQLISSLLLLQQRGRVIDGLFPQRWNRLFTKKKNKITKKRNCQWGAIKPMHLECSYSCATVIYLFTPQKLLWPSRINVSLLKSVLNG